ncbi:MAG TPA: hypothetical protein VGQ36_17730 [Thermoanaerobaculia bacterium]|jgi:hypothetical protein|nr:hypothetical protein [Thermoanaerobaculia bacterium]
MFRTVRASLILFVLIASTASAQTSPCPVLAAAKGIARITIDARTGQVDGSKHFKRTQNAEVVIINKNPFRYVYRVDVKEERIAEPGLAAFLPFVAPIQLPEIPKPAATPQSGADIADVCSKLTELKARDEQLGSDRETIMTNLSTAEAAIKTATDQYNLAKKTLESPDEVCTTLFTTATDIEATLRPFSKAVELSAIEKVVDKIEKDATKQLEELTAFKKAKPDCLSADLFARMKERAELYSTAVPAKMREALAKLKQSKQTLDTALKDIQAVLAKGTLAFTQIISIGEYDEATTVTVNLDRKDKITAGAEFEDVATPKLSFGGPAWFTLAGGAAGSAIDRAQFVRVQGFAQKSDGTLETDLSTLVGEKENSSSRITPIVMLHGRIYDARAFMPVTIQLSLGLSAKNDNLGTDIEYLVGPSIGLLDNKLFFTAGLYGGRTQKLQGNLTVGTKVPASLTEIPVRKDLEWKAGFALTYKIK